MSTPFEKALEPIAPILWAPKTEDLAIQEPEVGWWLHSGKWHRIELPLMTYKRLHGISVMAAAQTRQVINHNKPILTTDLPGDLRLQAMMEPCQPPGTMALTFRRGDKEIDEVEDVPSMYNTSRWNQWHNRKERKRALLAPLLELYDSGDVMGWLKAVTETRQTGIICGDTGAGKSRLSKMLGGMVSMDDRIIVIEDAAELKIRQPNHVRHFYSADKTTGVRPADLLKASLRERPSRIILGEMRDPEATAVFVSEVMAGHHGSLSTVHGSSAPEAARRMVDMASEGKLTDAKTVIAQFEATIDFIIPVENNDGVRSIGEIWFRPAAERDGHSFHDLLTD